MWIVFEAIRIHFKNPFVGFHTYKANHVNAQCWGTVSLLLIMIMCPTSRLDGVYRGRVCIPIVITLALVDPISGELKFRGFIQFFIAFFSLLLALLIHFLSVAFLGTPWWLAFILAPCRAVFAFLVG